MRHFVGVDIGGTNYTVALADERGDIVEQFRRRTSVARGAQGVVDGVTVALAKLLRTAKRRRRVVERIGLGFGGPVDFARQQILRSHHVEGWADYPLCETLAARFQVPCVMDNDGNVGALGEWRFGAGHGHRDLLYVNLGTGIGGGLILDGQLVRGARNLAGEIGHLTVNPNGPVCTCGRRGCLESLAAGPYLARRATEVRGAPTTSESLFIAAQAGEQWARAIVAEAANALAFAIGATLCLCNPSVVILGGGIAEAGDTLLRPVRRALQQYALDFNRRGVKLVRAQLGYDAGVRGAVALAMA